MVVALSFLNREPTLRLIPQDFSASDDITLHFSVSSCLYPRWPINSLVLWNLWLKSLILYLVHLELTFSSCNPPPTLILLGSVFIIWEIIRNEIPHQRSYSFIIHLSNVLAFGTSLDERLMKTHHCTNQLRFI